MTVFCGLNVVLGIIFLSTDMLKTADLTQDEQIDMSRACMLLYSVS